MRRFAILACLIASPALAEVTGPNGKTIDCYCTDTQGLRVELGEIICLRVDGRAFMAQCDMSLNVPIWRDVPSLAASGLDGPRSRPSRSC